MEAAAYKRLFSRPGMVRDLLRGFAARDWSGTLDFDSLTPLPASYVSRDLRQRHGDLVWRVRFGGERWLYLVLLLEFQSGVDRAMTVRWVKAKRYTDPSLRAADSLMSRGYSATGSASLFPVQRGRPVAMSTLPKMLQHLAVVARGFRSSFQNWAADKTHGHPLCWSRRSDP